MRRCTFGIFIVVVVLVVVLVTASSPRIHAYYNNVIMAEVEVEEPYVNIYMRDHLKPIGEYIYIAEKETTQEASTSASPEIEETESEPVRTYYDSIPLSADLQDVVFETAEEYDVNPALILGIIEVESNFKTGAVSSSGCYGLMQLSGRYFGYNLSPADNIRTGTKQIARLLTKYGSVHKALVCYNLGEGGAKGISSSSYSNKVVSAMEKWEAVLND